MIAEFHRRESGRIEVAIGVNIVAAISPWAGMQRGLGRVEAYYVIKLGDDRRMVPASTMTRARVDVLRRLAEWFEACGPDDVTFLVIAQALKEQSEEERAAANSPALFSRRPGASPP